MLKLEDLVKNGGRKQKIKARDVGTAFIGLRCVAYKYGERMELTLKQVMNMGDHAERNRRNMGLTVFLGNKTLVVYEVNDPPVDYPNVSVMTASITVEVTEKSLP